MKPPTARPDEPQMRFFTPELFARFNATDDSIADQANEEWETALSQYGLHLDGLQLARQMAAAWNHYLHPPHRLDWDTVAGRQRAIHYDGGRQVSR